MVLSFDLSPYPSSALFPHLIQAPPIILSHWHQEHVNCIVLTVPAFRITKDHVQAEVLVETPLRLAV